MNNQKRWQCPYCGDHQTLRSSVSPHTTQEERDEEENYRIHKEFNNNASAVLSRRCLEKILNDFCNIREKTIYLSVDKLKTISNGCDIGKSEVQKRFNNGLYENIRSCKRKLENNRG